MFVATHPSFIFLEFLSNFFNIYPNHLNLILRVPVSKKMKHTPAVRNLITVLHGCEALEPEYTKSPCDFADSVSIT